MRLHNVVLPISVEDPPFDIRNFCINFQLVSKGPVVLSVMEYVELQPVHAI